MRDTNEELLKWLQSGGRTVGQLLITPLTAGWEVRHVDDAGRDDLETHAGAAAARALANLDDAGVYRPLKTAPNTRHGWRIEASTVADLRKALDAFYPAMLGVWLAHRDGAVQPVHLRETLGRQTGMYRVTQKITDEQAQSLIGTVCAPGACAKTILWQLDATLPLTGLPAEKFQPAGGDALPLLCQEACNFLVAGARKVVKGEPL